MAIGMPYDEFWYGLPSLVKAYKRAYDIKKRETNEILWLQGLYNYNAVASAIARCVNGDKKAQYTEKPLDIFPKTKAEKEIEAEKERQKIIAHFNIMKANWDRTHKGQ